jgi:hypothetical protein
MHSAYTETNALMIMCLWSRDHRNKTWQDLVDTSWHVTQIDANTHLLQPYDENNGMGLGMGSSSDHSKSVRRQGGGGGKENASPIKHEQAASPMSPSKKARGKCASPSPSRRDAFSWESTEALVLQARFHRAR